MKKIISYCISAVIGVSPMGGILQNTFSEKTELNKNVEMVAISRIENVSSNVEILDWWTEASKIFSRGTTATVTDIATGVKFNIERTMGDNHADCETLTPEDTEKMKEVFGGFNWQKRPIIVTVNGRNLAASMAGMPHAGSDAVAAFASADNRSDGYGSGQNLDVIKGNDMDGHFDVHFPNSTKHADGRITATIDEVHQANIKIAAQYKIK